MRIKAIDISSLLFRCLVIKVEAKGISIETISTLIPTTESSLKVGTKVGWFAPAPCSTLKVKEMGFRIKSLAA
jgi:hypothetical protein